MKHDRTSPPSSRAHEKRTPEREPYQPPRVRVIEIGTQEALMGICKAAGSPCMAIAAPGS
ncbi:MAG: hypothetical protein DRH15_14405 [Deltaproteobacteria bacterium]|nr:MAG: hypothetical protein DRI34_09220 [Deltaproteobacteria bacterium]RLB75223.1 MAG: hypothetical protein DRH15_14405 [Deltaproteobacteria bacterium]